MNLEQVVDAVAQWREPQPTSLGFSRLVATGKYAGQFYNMPVAATYILMAKDRDKDTYNIRIIYRTIDDGGFNYHSWGLTESEALKLYTMAFHIWEDATEVLPYSAFCHLGFADNS